MEVPVLGPIPTQPFDLESLQGPPEPGRQLDLHIDLEGSGGRMNTLNGVCAIGLYGVDTVTLKPILSYEVAVTPLVCDDPVQIKTFWEIPAHQSAWKRIVEARRPRLEVASEIVAITGRLKDLGWKLMLFARPACYDFRELTGFFQSLGVEYARFTLSDLESGIAETGALPSVGALKYVLSRASAQMVTGFSLDQKVEEDSRGTMTSPFGFGGASHVTCVGQIFIGIAFGLGFEPAGFNDVMKRVIGRSALAHGGLQDAIDQAATWYAVREARGNPARLRELLEK